MFLSTTVQAMLVVLLLGTVHVVGVAAAGDLSEGSSLQDRLAQLLARKSDHASDQDFLVRLADVYLDLGDDLTLERSKRKAAYEEGAKAARKTIELREQNADAHYLYAANLGSSAQLTGLMASALTVQDLKRHVDRALELQPNHAAALHMKGMMLEELPWVLGGDSDGALENLQRAVAANPDYVHARLDLAKLYMKRKNPAAARRELDAILLRPLRSDASASVRRHREEAQRLLRTLPGA